MEISTSKEVMDRIHRAFQLWESASGEALQFEFGGWGKASYDGYSQLPYDGDIYLVLTSRYSFSVAGSRQVLAQGKR
jgi:hypothetical protein